MYLYLAVSAMAVSATLIREEDKKQLPIYYISQAFQGAEVKYPRIEKIAFALIVASCHDEPNPGNDGSAHQKVHEQTRGSKENGSMGN